MKAYRTMKAARSALALDTGFDPFLCGGGRCTKAKLAELGYTVDAAKAAELERTPHCGTCQDPVEAQWTGLGYEYPSHCREHHKWGYGCDNGHRWTATDAEDGAADHKCPICGEYWQ